MDSHLSWQKIITASLLVAFMNLVSCKANQMDPHVFPKTGPFVEGWYLRIIDPHQNVSLGFMFGHVLPSPALSIDVENQCKVLLLHPLTTDCMKSILEKQTDEHTSESKYGNITESPHLVFVGLLLSLETHAKLDNPAGYFSPSQFNITVDGKPVETNPDNESPAHFEVRIAQNFSFVVNSNGSRFSVQVGHHILQGETMGPVPWGPKGEGPEGWLEMLPLPFHWYVYSLRSTVKYYQYINKQTGKQINGTSGQDVHVVAHMEKNWGRGFPVAWIWSEGVDPRTEVLFVFSAGLVTTLSLDIKAQLSGYRNPRKQISCNFNPSNSIHSLHFDECAGTVVLKVESLVCAVIFQVSAPSETFSFCLDAPMAVGFRKNCVESFVAVANITVYQRHGMSMILTDNQIIQMSALEFGGAYMCNGQCPVDQ